MPEKKGGPAVRCGGIDVGSSAIKVAVVEEETNGGELRLLAHGVERIRKRHPLTVLQELFQGTIEDAGLSREELDYIATTGEGELVPFRTGHFYGMTAHARGALHLDPEARAAVDIGALHTRAILMDERAKVLGYRMTSQCASGSGQFLENIGRYLGVTLEEIGPLSLQADDPEACSSICAVLAETDVINMVSRGITVPNIIKGIHQSMAGRYLRLITSTRASGVVMVTGGLAADVGLLQAMREAAAEQNVGVEVRAHPLSVLAGALGAAIWGAFRYRKLAEKGVSLSA
ncbi:MAG TPA: benzoyl-CoA reductase subunit D [Vicinamibacteria bacterium]|nr:benzoyl-CoA reductase subunit D [Vicinamibacteria bacterium]